MFRKCLKIKNVISFIVDSNSRLLCVYTRVFTGACYYECMHICTMWMYVCACMTTPPMGKTSTYFFKSNDNNKQNK